MPNATKPADGTDPDDSQALIELVDRAQKGDATALPDLRQWLQNPEVVDVLGGDLARQAEHSLLDRATGKDLSFREAVLRKLETMRAELAGPAPSPLERLLAERVVTCWLQVHDADIRLAQNETKLSLAQAEYHQSRCDRAHRRYLSAIKTLATVRKLALPVLQVNIARKQVNVAGPCLPADGRREVV
jgi:hypothetical protein